MEKMLRIQREKLIFKKRVQVDYRPKSDDIFLVSYPKSGTTWVQHILYQLLHEGAIDYKHISEVSPFFDVPYPQQHFEEVPSPRILKSHLPYGSMPKADLKIIYVFRNVEDVLLSYYHHYQSLHGFKGSLEQFLSLYERQGVYSGYWGLHVHDWLKNKKGKRVHFVRYEALVQDFDNELIRLAHFLEVGLRPDIADKIKEQSSFDFMKLHEEKFDYQYELQKKRARAVPGHHIRKGKIGEGQEQLSSAEHPHVQKERQALRELMDRACPLQLPER